MSVSLSPKLNPLIHSGKCIISNRQLVKFQNLFLTLDHGRPSGDTKTSEFAWFKFSTRQLWKVNWNPARETYSTHEKKFSTHNKKVWAHEKKNDPRVDKLRKTGDPEI